MAETTYSEQEQVRRDELARLQEMGIDPYPPEGYPTTHTTAEVRGGFSEAEAEQWQSVALAGRIMVKRVQGKASFVELQDESGRMQVYFNRDDLCPQEDKTLYNTVFKQLLSIGDIIGVTGYIFITRTGEITLRCQSFRILAKTLRPLPLPKEVDGKVYDAFTDPEQRYRMRYVDLTVNHGVKETFIKRSRMVQAIRDYFNQQGFLEVETPILQPIYGGALARPFVTHHNTLDMDLYLRIANELYLKRLIVGGFHAVYEFAKDFRNEGISRFHNPEFTQVEVYVAYRDYLWMMDLMEATLEYAAIQVNGSTKVQVGEHEIDFQRPWKRYTLYEAIETFTGQDVSQMGLEELRSLASRLGVEVDPGMERPHLIDEIVGVAVEPVLIQPTILMDYPLEMSPLAKKHREVDGLVERFEVVCNGKEISNAYTELNDPVDQRARLEEQARMRAAGDEDAMSLDEDFLRALEYGMPPTTGLGIGIDRLAMIMTGAPSIKDVLFFPQMRPETLPPDM